MKDVARKSGWSLGTVSRVFNQMPGVNERAREEILAAAETLNYSPSQYARELRRKRRAGILMIVRPTRSGYDEELARSLKERLESRNFQVMLAESNLTQDEGELCLNLCESIRPSLLLFFGARRDKIRNAIGRMKIPAISAGADLEGEGFEKYFSLQVPETEKFMQAAEALFEAGCQNIGVLMTPRSEYGESAAKLLGIQYAFYSRDCVFKAGLQSVEAPATPEGGYQGIMELQKKIGNPDGLLIFDCRQASGAMRAIADLQIRIPEQLKVITMDENASGDFMVPRLAGFRRNPEKDVQYLEDLCICLGNPGGNLPEQSEVRAEVRFHFDESFPETLLKGSDALAE